MSTRLIAKSSRLRCTLEKVQRPPDSCGQLQPAFYKVEYSTQAGHSKWAYPVFYSWKGECGWEDDTPHTTLPKQVKEWARKQFINLKLNTLREV